MISNYRAYPRPNRGSVALRADQFDLDPVLSVAAIIPQQRRHIAHVQHQCVDIAIIVVIAEGRALGWKIVR